MKRSVLASPIPPTSRVIFRPHALTRMHERNISEGEIEYLLQHGYDIRANYLGRPQSGASGDKFLFYRDFEGRDDNGIAVIAIFPKDQHYDWEVITVMNNYLPEGWKDWDPTV